MLKCYSINPCPHISIYGYCSYTVLTVFFLLFMHNLNIFEFLLKIEIKYWMCFIILLLSMVIVNANITYVLFLGMIGISLTLVKTFGIPEFFSANSTLFLSLLFIKSMFLIL